MPSAQVIMANWSENDADYKTKCPYCKSYLVASLTIIKKQVRMWGVQLTNGPSHLLTVTNWLSII